MRPSAQRVAQRKLAGAASFEVYVRGTDARRAFREAVEDAKHEHGHGGYTGTIAEKGGEGYEVRRDTPMSQHEAQEFINRDMERADKWGPAFAVPVASSKTVAEKDVTVKVKARNRDEAAEQAKKLVWGKIRTRAGAKPILTVGYGDIKDLKSGGLPTITKAKSTERPYFIIEQGLRGHGTGSRYDRKPEATAALKKLLAQPNIRVGDTFAIVKKQPLDTIKVTKLGTKLPQWEVKVRTKQIKVGKPEGWIFYGIASE